MDTGLPEIAKISRTKWRAHLSGCQEAEWFCSAEGARILALWEYSHCFYAQFGNKEWRFCNDLEGAPLVHFLCRTPLMSFLG